MDSGRPRKPSYSSMRKVLNAIGYCSCGKWEREGTASYGSEPVLASPFFEGSSCGCVGPKSWTQLLALTGLHRNTLSRTCKFLVGMRVLERTVLKKRGHHVRYSIGDSYRGSLKSELTLPLKERRRVHRELLRACARTAGLLPKGLYEHYGEAVGLLDQRFPGARELPTAEYFYLVRMVDLFGFEGGVHQCFLMLKRLGPRGYHVAASLSVYGYKRLRSIARSFNRPICLGGLSVEVQTD